MMDGGTIRRTALAAVLAGVSILSACDGSSPTEPDRDKNVMVFASIRTTPLAETIRRVQILFDGKVIRDYSSSGGFSDILFNGLTMAGKGQHRVEFRIVDQTRSPQSFRISGSVDVLSDGGSTQSSITLPEKTVSLATGQGVTYTFSI